MASPSYKGRARESNYTNVGFAGRKTGLVVQDTGVRDEHGMEDMDAFFSPVKVDTPLPPPPARLFMSSDNNIPSPISRMLSSSSMQNQTGEQTATEGTMIIPESSGIGPTEALTARKRQFSLPLVGRSSPIRYTVSGSPRRGSSIGPQNSPIRQLSVPPIRPSSPSKRLDFNRGGPIRNSSPVPKPNGRPSALVSAAATKEHEPVKKPTVEEPPKRPFGAGKKGPVQVEKILEEDETQPQVEFSSPSVPTQKKKPKRGLMSGKTAAPKPFSFDADETEEEPDTTTGNTTVGRDTLKGEVSQMLDDSSAVVQDGVDTADATPGPLLDQREEEDTQMDDANETEPELEPVILKKVAKPRKISTPEPELEDEDVEDEDLEPTLLKKAKPAAKKITPTKTKKPAGPESKPILEDDNDEVEPTKLGKRASKQGPVKKSISKKALEPEFESDGELEPVVPKKRLPARKSAPKSAAPAKGKRRPELELEAESGSEQQSEEEEEEGVEFSPPPKKRGGKQTQTAKPTKSTKLAKKASKPEADDPESEPESEPTKPTKGKGTSKKVAPPPLGRKDKSTKAAAVDTEETLSSRPGAKGTVVRGPTTPRGRAKKATAKLTPAQLYDFQNDTEVEVVEEEEKEPPKKKPRGVKALRPVKSVVSSRAPNSAPKKPTKAFISRKIELQLEPELEAEGSDEKNGEAGAEAEEEDEMEDSSSRPSRSHKAKAPTKKKLIPTKATKATKGKARDLSASDENYGTQRIIYEKPPSARDASIDVEGKRRSSRRRLAPLAYWKGEKIEYALGGTDDHKSTIRMPEMVEIVRIESDHEGKQKKRRATSKRATSVTASKKRKRATKAAVDDAESSESSDLDPGELEAWEQGIGVTNDDAIGVKKGHVRMFEPVIDSEGEEELQELQLAFSKERIVTVDVANGDFKFVKTFTEDHFGAGVIEIPPGGCKRTKNSGKMSLIFYLVRGRATVTINGNRFRVGAGGQIMVPRGNLYSIENEYDKTVKMFFAQARAPQPSGDYIYE